MYMKTKYLNAREETGEGNGNPPQYSCLENPMDPTPDRHRWWASQDVLMAPVPLSGKQLQPQAAGGKIRSTFVLVPQATSERSEHKILRIHTFTVFLKPSPQ